MEPEIKYSVKELVGQLSSKIDTLSTRIEALDSAVNTLISLRETENISPRLAEVEKIVNRRAPLYGAISGFFTALVAMIIKFMTLGH